MTETNSNGTITIALKELDPDPKNVRRTYTESGIRELAASIKANGFLQNPVVRSGKKGRYFVIASGRRLAGLGCLSRQAMSQLTFLFQFHTFGFLQSSHRRE